MITVVTWDPKDAGLRALTEIAGILATREGQPRYLSHLVTEGVVVISDRPLGNVEAHLAWEEWAAYPDEAMREEIDFTCDTSEFAYDIATPDIDWVERTELPIELWGMFAEHNRNLNAIYGDRHEVAFTEYLVRDPS